MPGIAMIAAFAAAALPCSPPSSAPGDERVPVLVLTGQGAHDWEWTSAALEQLLERQQRFDVTISADPAAALAERASLDRYRAFLLDFEGPRWGEPAESNFLDAVHAGAGAVVLHAAAAAFPGWVEYERLVGRCWREGAGREPFHPFDVRIDDRAHPVTAGLFDLRLHPDELCYGLAPMHGAEPRALASALSRLELGGSGQREPLILVDQYGAGRVFHTPLGHVARGADASRASYQDEQFQALLLRAVEWAATGRVDDRIDWANTLTELEREAGWELLFDGASTDGWRAWTREEFPAAGWSVVNGCLRVSGTGEGGDIVSRREFGDFELEFEWMLASGGNGGVKYRVPLIEGEQRAFGPEYQILDDARSPDARDPLRRAGSMNNLVPAEPRDEGRCEPLGAFNRSRVTARGPRIEHWLNGARVVSIETGTQRWKDALSASLFSSAPEFGSFPSGALLIEDFMSEVWYRSLRVRDLANLPGERVEPFDGTSLAGWKSVGDASFSADDGAILGQSTSGAHSFLVTERAFGDFLLELEVKTEGAGNSGIQVRSHLTEDGRVQGYQIEIDPSERAWSGGLYDEGRRGWLQDLSRNEAGRKAFRPGEWNHYWIECVGPSIRVRVNGVETADYLDAADLEGFIGLQVHSGKDTRVRWRNLRLWDLGTRSWMKHGTISRDTGPVGPDGCSRGRFKTEKGAPALVLWQGDLRESSPSTTGADFDLSDGDGLVPLADASSYRPGDWNEVVLYAYGPKIAVDLNGKRHIELRGPSRTSFPGWLVFGTSEEVGLVEFSGHEYAAPPTR